MSLRISRILSWLLLAGLLIPFFAHGQDAVDPAIADVDATTPVGIEPVEDPEEMIEFSLRDETLAQVLYLLEQLTGRSVIRPQALPSPTFTFNSLAPLTRQEAILAIESLRSINGIGVAPLGEKFIP